MRIILEYLFAAACLFFCLIICLNAVNSMNREDRRP